MKTLLIGLLALGSVSAMASLDCYVNNKAGDHIELNQKEVLDTGAPFGVVRIRKISRYMSPKFLCSQIFLIFSWIKINSFNNRPISR
jgi:hypothetical protein